MLVVQRTLSLVITVAVLAIGEMSANSIPKMRLPDDDPPVNEPTLLFGLLFISYIIN